MYSKSDERGPDPYEEGMVQDPYVTASPVVGEVVAVLRGKLQDRGLQLIPQPSRALKQGDIHEMVVTDEAAEPSQTVDRVAYLGFCEIIRGGVAKAGDRVQIGEQMDAVLLGYDATHAPNHYNIVFSASSLRDGVDSGLKLGMSVHFRGTLTE